MKTAWLTFILIVLSQSASAADAGGHAAGTPRTLSISIGSHSEDGAFARAAADYEAATGIAVVVHGFETMRANLDAPYPSDDILCMSHDRLAGMIGERGLKPVSIPQALAGDMHPQALRAVTLQGKQWAYPLVMEAPALLYNKALVPTPPASFEEVEALDRRLSAARGVRAITWDYANTYFSWPLLAAGGAYVFAADGDGGFDVKRNGLSTRGAADGIRYIKRLVGKGMLPSASSYAASTKAMNTGTAAMAINGPWAWDNLKLSSIDFGVAPIPSLKGKPSRPLVMVWGCAVRDTPDSAIAEDFLQNHLLRAQTLVALFRSDTLSGVPVSTTVSGQIEDEHVRALAKVVEQGQLMPSTVANDRFWNTAGEALSSIFTRSAKVEQALRKASDELAGR